MILAGLAEVKLADEARQMGIEYEDATDCLAWTRAEADT